MFVLRASNHNIYMDVSENSGTPKSSNLIGFSVMNHPFWGTPIFGNTHIIIPAIEKALPVDPDPGQYQKYRHSLGTESFRFFG